MQSGSQYEEVAGWSVGLIVGMRNACGHEDSRTLRSFDFSISESECQGSFQDMPCFIISIVDMKVVGATT